MRGTARITRTSFTSIVIDILVLTRFYTTRLDVTAFLLSPLACIIPSRCCSNPPYTPLVFGKAGTSSSSSLSKTIALSHRTSVAGCSSSVRINDWDDGGYDDVNDDDNDDDDLAAGTTTSGSMEPESDWMQGEMFLVVNSDKLDPSMDMGHEMVARIICRSLQWVDYPQKNAGLLRCFNFLTYECRKAVTARQGADTIERFVQYGLLSPAFQPFMGAKRILLGDPGPITPAQPPIRGALISYPIQIIGADVLAVQYPSGMVRNGIQTDPPIVNMMLRLEQQRRPPYQQCWLVREVLDVRYAFAGDMGNDIPQ